MAQRLSQLRCAAKRGATSIQQILDRHHAVVLELGGFCEGRVAEALADLGEELAAARDAYGEVKKLDQTLFEKDYESL